MLFADLILAYGCLFNTKWCKPHPLIEGSEKHAMRLRNQKNEQCKVSEKIPDLRNIHDKKFSFTLIDCKSNEKCVPNGNVYLGQVLG